MTQSAIIYCDNASTIKIANNMGFMDELNI